MKVVTVFLTLVVLAGCESRPNSTTNSTSSGTSTPTKRADKSAEASETSRDNTTVNMRDKSQTTLTPVDQNENKKDVDITASIRKQVVATEMSTNAHNAKIITQDGKVTLRGPVKSEDEKKQIEKIAHDVSGVSSVDNQLEVQP